MSAIQECVVYRISRISPPRIRVYHETCSRRLPFIEFVVCYISLSVCVCVLATTFDNYNNGDKKKADRERRTNDTRKIGIESIIYLVGSQRRSIDTPMKCFIKT